MDIWHARFSEQDLMDSLARATVAEQVSKKAVKRAEKVAAKTTGKAHSRDSLSALSKLAELVDGEYRIVSDPPIVVPARELGPSLGMSADEIEGRIHALLLAYRQTLQDDRRELLERFQLVDVARKVVGVGSVGNVCVHRLAPGARPARSLVPAGQGSHRVGPRGSPAEEPVRPTG